MKNNQQGWIKIHRQILEWEWYDEPNTFRVFFHLLLKANHKEKNYRGVTIKIGQVMTGFDLLARETSLSVQKVRTALNRLKSTNEITIKSSSQGTIIQLVNYKKYQLATSEITNEQQTTNKRATTNKNVNKEKNEEIIDYLNLKNNSTYKHTTPKTKALIESRINEGFTVEDFKTVIDNKVTEWKDDRKMSKFLRPETLFSNKFEGYLNQKSKSSGKSISDMTTGELLNLGS